MVNASGSLEVDAIPEQSSGNSSFNTPKTAKLKRERRGQSSEDSSVLVPVEDGASTILRPRSYQREMLEQSLQRNIIVAVQPLFKSRE